MGRIDIQLIRHATVKINYNGTTFLVDPCLGPKGSFPGPDSAVSSNPLNDLPVPDSDVISGVDAVLLTHIHADHFDAAARDALDKALPVFTGEPVAAPLNEDGFCNIFCDEQSTFKGVTVSRTLGKHGPDALQPGLGPNWGFVLQAPSCQTLYVIGDGPLGQEVRSVLDKFSPDIILANPGGLVRGGNRLLMNAEEAVELAELCPKAKVICAHLEAIDICPVTRARVQELAGKAGVTIYTPQDGEVLSF